MDAPSFSRRVLEGEDRERQVCDACGFVAYENPKVVVGSVVGHDGRILLCRRAIEPRRGFWTIPAGYMELGETAEEGALREAWEEARARLRLERLLAQPQRAVDVFHVLFRRKITPYLLGMATGESLAHLNCLIARGRAVRETDAEGVDWYRAA